MKCIVFAIVFLVVTLTAAFAFVVPPSNGNPGGFFMRRSTLPVAHAHTSNDVPENVVHDLVKDGSMTPKEISKKCVKELGKSPPCLVKRALKEYLKQKEKRKQRRQPSIRYPSSYVLAIVRNLEEKDRIQGEKNGGEKTNNNRRACSNREKAGNSSDGSKRGGLNDSLCDPVGQASSTEEGKTHVASTEQPVIKPNHVAASTTHSIKMKSKDVLEDTSAGTSMDRLPRERDGTEQAKVESLPGTSSDEWTTQQITSRITLKRRRAVPPASTKISAKQPSISEHLKRLKQLPVPHTEKAKLENGVRKLAGCDSGDPPPPVQGMKLQVGQIGLETAKQSIIDSSNKPPPTLSQAKKQVDSVQSHINIEKSKRFFSNLYKLEQPISTLRGVGPKIAEAFARLNLHTVRSLLWHFPTSFTDRTKICTNITQAIEGEIVTVVVKVESIHISGKTLRVKTRDPSNRVLGIVYFCGSSPGVAIGYRKLFGGILNERIVSGKIHKLERGDAEIVHPDWVKPVGEANLVQRIEPKYRLTKGVSQTKIIQTIDQALELGKETLECIPEVLSPSTLESLSWPTLSRALILAHRPETEADFEEGPTSPPRMRLLFEELCMQQVRLALLRQGMHARSLEIPCSTKHTPPLLQDGPLDSLDPFAKETQFIRNTTSSYARSLQGNKTVSIVEKDLSRVMSLTTKDYGNNGQSNSAELFRQIVANSPSGFRIRAGLAFFASCNTSFKGYDFCSALCSLCELAESDGEKDEIDLLFNELCATLRSTVGTDDKTFHVCVETESTTLGDSSAYPDAAPAYETLHPSVRSVNIEMESSDALVDGTIEMMHSMQSHEEDLVATGLDGTSLQVAKEPHYEEFPLQVQDGMNEDPEIVYLLVDTETTGLSTKSHIIQMAAKVLGSVDPDERFSAYCLPPIHLSPMIEDLTGITNSFLCHGGLDRANGHTIKGPAPPFAQVYKSFCDFCKKIRGNKEICILAHNAPFDVRMLNAEVKRMATTARAAGKTGGDVPLFSRDTGIVSVIDTLQLFRSREVWQETVRPSSLNLEGVYRHIFNAPMTLAHNAYGDVLGLEKILLSKKLQGWQKTGTKIKTSLALPSNVTSNLI